MSDRTIKISIPLSKERELPESYGIDTGERFTSRAATILKKLFGNDYWTLREARGTADVELKISIRETRLAELRSKIAELGFTELSRTQEEMSDEDAGRRG